MSNPVKNAEIEDVLSSIRRLVSESHSVGTAREAVETPTINADSVRAEQAPRPKAADRLVLSPVMRIEEPQMALAEAENAAPESPLELTSPVDDTPFVNSLKEDLVPLRENLPSFLQKRMTQKAADLEEAPDLHAEAQDATDIRSETAFASTRELSAEVTSDAVEEVAADLERDHLVEVENTLPFPMPKDLTFETARKETAVGEISPGEDLAQDNAQHSIQSEDTEARPWEIEGERLSEWHSTRGASLEDAAALDFEPDGPEDGDNAGIPVASLNWEDHETDTEARSEFTAQAAEDETPLVADLAIESEPTPDLDIAPHQAAPASDPVAEQISETVLEDISASQDTIDAQQYEAVLDEEMLRELVGEIVRQELQGPLGERITRNVRKLVRREINRALTARSFNDG